MFLEPVILFVKKTITPIYVRAPYQGLEKADESAVENLKEGLFYYSYFAA